MMLRTILLGLALYCVAGDANGQGSRQTLNGADFLAACTKADQEWIGFCNGYIQAAFDANGGKGVCAPEGVTRNQLFDAIIPKLMSASELLELSAISIIDAILRNEYPCD